MHTVTVAPNGGDYLGAMTAVVSTDTENFGNQHAGEIDWTFQVDDSAIDSLAQGQVLTQSYTVTVTDNNGASDSEVVTVTITGTNDAPVIGTADDSGSVQAEVIDPTVTVGTGDMKFHVEQYQGYSTNNLNTMQSIMANPSAYGVTLYEADADFIDFVDYPVTGYSATNQPWPAAAATGQTHYTGVNDFFFARITTDFDVTSAGNYTFRTYNDDGLYLFVDGNLVINDPNYHGSQTFTGTVNLSEGQHSLELFFFEHGGAAVLELSVADSSGNFQLMGQGAAGLGGVGGDVALTDSGSIAFSDVDLTDAHTVSVTPNGTGYLGDLTTAVADVSTGDGEGSVDWEFMISNADLEYLAEGETVTQTYTVTITDNTGASDSQQVTITLTGTNEAPVIGTADTTASVTEIADLAAGENATSHTVDGSINFSDVDTIDTHTVSVASNGAGYRGSMTAIVADASTGDNAGRIDWTFAIDDSAIDDLAAGQVLTQSYDITVDDGQGGTDTETVTVTITGTNDAPVVAAITAPASNEDAALVSIDLLSTSSDVDLTDDLDVASVAVASSDGRALAYAVDSETGAFSIDPSQHNDLAVGESETVTITYNVVDGNGGVTPNTATVLIEGRNDGPTATAINAGATHEDAAPINIDLLLTAADDDLSDDLDVANVSVASSDGRALAFSVDAETGAFSLDPSQYNDLAVGESETVTVTYDVVDGNGGVAANTASFVVEGRNDAPVFNTGPAAPIVEDFEGGATGWTNNTTNTSDTANFSEFLGNFGGGDSAQKTFALSGNQSTVTLEFDVYEFSTWDAERFRVFADGAMIVDDFFRTDGYPPNDGSSKPYAISVTNTKPALPGTANYNTEVWHYTITLNTSASDVTLQFASTLNQDPTDESWGLDNLVITEDAGGAAAELSGSVTEIADGAVGENGTNHVTDGSIAFGDVDLSDAHTVSATANGAGYRGTMTATVADASTGDGAGSIDWSFSIDDSAIDDLAAGQTLTQSYDITVDDGQGGTDTETVTVTITGTNDAPVIEASDTAGAVIESGNLDDGTVVAGTDVATGTMVSSDVDNGATAVWSGDAAGTYGSFAIDANSGDWTYTLDNGNALTDALAEGQSETETFAVTVTDDQGATATETVSIIVTGTNDVPTASAITAPTTNEDAGSVSIDLLATAADVDAADDLDVANVVVTSSDGRALSFSVDTETGAFSLDPSQYNDLAVGENATVTVSYDVIDSNGGIAANTATVLVEGRNDAPVAQSISGAVDEDAGQTQLSGNIGATSAPNLGRFYVFDFDTGASTTIARDTGSNNTYDQIAAQYLGSGNGIVAQVNPNSSGWGVASEVYVGGVGTPVDASQYSVTDTDGGPAAYQHGTYPEVLSVDDANKNVDQFALSLTGLTLSDGRVVDLDMNINGLDYEVNTTDDIAIGGVAFEAIVTTPSDVVTISADYADVDTSDTHTFSVDVSGTVGQLTNNNDGTFTYDANGQYDYLAVGETATDTFTYTVDDGNGGADTQTATITITGTNDAPTLQSNAGVLGFDEASATDSLARVVDGYGGFNWSTTGGIGGQSSAQQGDILASANGSAPSGPNAAWNGHASPLSIIEKTDGSTFVFNSASFASVTTATYGGELTSVTLTGYLNGNVIGTEVVNLGAFAEFFDWTSSLGAIDRLEITPQGPFNGGGWWAMDDFAYGDATEEDGAAIAIDLSALGDDLDSDDDGTTLTYSIVTGPSEGSASITGTSLSFDPGSDFQDLDDGETRTVTIEVMATDSHGATATNTMSVVVGGVNDAPVAIAAAFSGDEDTNIAGAVAATDADGDALTYSVVTGPANGSVVMNADGTFVYTPSGDYNGADSFTFIANDGSTDSAPQTVSLTVNAVNDAPVAAGTSVAGLEDTEITGAVTGSDIDGDALSYSIVDGPANGSVTMNADGTFSYTADANYSGADSFTAKANDGSLDSNVVTVDVAVEAVADAPVVELVGSGSGGDTPTFLSGEIQVNTTTASNQRFASVDALTNGNFVVAWTSSNQAGDSSSGNFMQIFASDGSKIGGEIHVNTYTNNSQNTPSVEATPDGGFIVGWMSYTQDGSSPASYGAYMRKFDASGTAVTNEIRMNQTTYQNQQIPEVTVLDDGNIIATWTSNLQDGSGLGVYQRLYNANLSPIGGEVLVNTTTSGSQGSPSVSALSGGYVTVWEAANVDGSGYGIAAQLYNNSGSKVGGEFVLNSTTTGNQRYPSVQTLANGDFVVSWHSTNGDGSGFGVMMQRFDSNGNALGGETVVNTSTIGDQRDASIVALSDGGYMIVWTSEPAASNVDNINSSPSELDMYAQRFDANGNAVGVEFQLNSTTAGAQFSYAKYGGENVVQLTDGTVVTVWEGDLTGNEIFLRLLDLGAGGSAPGTEDTDLAIDLSAALVDIDGSETLSLELSGFPTGATFNLGAASGANWVIPAAESVDLSTLTMNPPANWNGTFTLSVTATATEGSNGDTATTTTSADLTIEAVNDAPTSSDETVAGDEDTTITGTVTGADIDGDALTFDLVAGAANGTVTLNSDGTYSYVPNANFNGSDSFTFVANDGAATSAVQTVSITVNPVNDAPVADTLVVSGNEDTTLNSAVTGSDVDGDSVTFAVVSGPANGSVAMNADGTFTYTPDANYNGGDSFTFVANDGAENSFEQVVAITVNPVNDAPEANALSVSGNEDSAISGAVIGSDVDGDALTYGVVSGPSNGSVSMNADGTFSYTPGANYNGADSFTFRANDGTANSADQIVSISISAVNDAPTASDAAVAGDEDTTITGTVVGADVDGDALTFDLVTGAANGTVTLNSDGTYSYAPNANFNGTDSFTFRSNDGVLTSAVQTVSITVNPVNDAPVAVADSATTDEDTAVLIDVLTNDTDVDGDTLSVTTASVSSGSGSVSIVGGVLSYDPGTAYQSLNAGQNATVTIDYTVSDGNGGSSVGSATVTVTGVNDGPPIANYVTLTNGNDTWTGQGGNQQVDALAGNDTVYGDFNGWYRNYYYYNDTFGSDVIYAGAGGDIVYGDGEYMRSYYNYSGSQTFTGGADVLYGQSENDRMVGDFNRFEAYYTYYNRTVTVNGGDDQMYGEGGNDTMYGDLDYARTIYRYGGYTRFYGGEDSMDGGDGADIMIGDFYHAREDSTYYYGYSSGNAFYQGGNDIMSGGAGNDTISGDFYYTRSNTNTWTGFYGGADTIEGGEGNDQLYGDFVSNYSTGSYTTNGGADVFVFNPNSGSDNIHDFQDGVDRLDVSGYGFTSAADMTIGTSGSQTYIQFSATDVVYLQSIFTITDDDFIF
jgi:VCBS repeat-containing protein